MKILILYDGYSTNINTIHEYLLSFQKYMNAEVHYAPATHDIVSRNFDDLSAYDVILFNYSVRLSLDWHISPSWLQQVFNFKGVKALFVQDEYDTTEQLRIWIERLKFDLVFTCVPANQIHLVYDPKRFPETEFVNVLTGYAPKDDSDYRPFILPSEERHVIIGYRGRALAHWYGDLAREKMEIGVQVRSWCEKAGIKCDIEWDDSKRIYGDDWYRFLGSSLTTLGTESGSNVFDDLGSIRASIEAEVKRNPGITYELIKEKYLIGLDGIVKMNQISPKIFESICLRTGLILFEGKYSGVLEPHKHFFPLKKDFSNLDELNYFLADRNRVKQMTESAYQDVILSGKFSYQSFIQMVEGKLTNKIKEVKSPGYGGQTLFFNAPEYSKIKSQPVAFLRDQKVLDFVADMRKQGLANIFLLLANIFLANFIFLISKRKNIFLLAPKESVDFLELTMFGSFDDNLGHLHLKSDKTYSLIAYPRSEKKFIFDLAAQKLVTISIRFDGKHKYRFIKFVRFSRILDENDSILKARKTMFKNWQSLPQPVKTVLKPFAKFVRSLWI